MKQGNNESIIPVTITSTLNTIWAIGTSITASAVLIKVIKFDNYLLSDN